VFVRNLPEELDRFGLRGIFEKIGKVHDSYIPRRGTQWKGRRFGFVRFRQLRDATACIQRLNGTWVRGHKIHISMARPRRINQSRWMRKGTNSRQVWLPKRSNTSLGTNNNAKQVWIPKMNDQRRDNSKKIRQRNEEEVRVPCLKGQPVEYHKEWLQRTLVCTSEIPRDVATIHSAISMRLGPSVKITALSSYKFLLTFLTVEDMRQTLSNLEDMKQWFGEIKQWGSAETCESRRVWLSIVGIPPHGWRWDNFKMTAALWGVPLCMNRSAKLTESFEVMKVLIVTKIMHRIEGEVLLHLDYEGYRVFVKEIDTVSQDTHQMHRPEDNIEDNESNFEVPGFEDLADSEGIERNNGSHSQPLEEAEKMLNLDAKLNSNSTFEVVSAIKNDGQQEVEGSRTKTASFSQNGYSEELAKISQHLKRKSASLSHNQEESEVQEPPGFEKATSNQNTELNAKISNTQGQEAALKGERKTATRKSGGLTVNSEGHLYQNTRKSKQISNVSHSPTESEGTTDSMVQFAEDSLQIGELVGVRVVGHKKAAIARITDHLKQRKIQKRTIQKQKEQQQ